MIIKGAKLTAKALAKAMKAFIESTRKRGNGPAAPGGMGGKGKQTVRQLIRQGAGVSSIEITDKNIKPFQAIARKYGVDFALKKDPSEKPPRWLVFFKGKDADALMAAFKEFSAKQLKKAPDKPSVIEAIRSLAEKAKGQAAEKVKHKERGHEL